jgi:hypothetical protein
MLVAKGDKNVHPQVNNNEKECLIFPVIGNGGSFYLLHWWSL